MTNAQRNVSDTVGVNVVRVCTYGLGALEL
jgi:hypothetical protein